MNFSTNYHSNAHGSLNPNPNLRKSELQDTQNAYFISEQCSKINKKTKKVQKNTFKSSLKKPNSLHKRINQNLKGNISPLESDDEASTDCKATQRVALVDTSKFCTTPEKIKQYIQSLAKTTKLIINHDWSLAVFEEDSIYDKIIAETLPLLEGQVITMEVREMSSKEIKLILENINSQIKKQQEKVFRFNDNTNDQETAIYKTVNSDFLKSKLKLEETEQQMQNQGCCLVVCCGRQSRETQFSFKLKQGRDCYLDIRSAFFLGQMYKKSPLNSAKSSDSLRENTNASPFSSKNALKLSRDLIKKPNWEIINKYYGLY